VAHPEPSLAGQTFAVHECLARETTQSQPRCF